MNQKRNQLTSNNFDELLTLLPGTPRPTVQWSKLEGPIPASAIIGEGILIIPEAKPEDAGTYRCTATNVAGSVQSQVQLFVQCKSVGECPLSVGVLFEGWVRSLWREQFLTRIGQMGRRVPWRTQWSRVQPGEGWALSSCTLPMTHHMVKLVVKSSGTPTTLVDKG